MNFRAICRIYVEFSKNGDKIKVRRNIWPPSMHVIFGTVTLGSTVAWREDYGTQESGYTKFGISLIMNGETVVFGWCPTIDDVMGQDWIFIEGCK